MDSFKQEITRLIPQLRRYAFALVNHNDMADDLVQDSLERALAKQHLWNPSLPIKPWLLTVLHNIFANNARKYRRTPCLVSIHEIEEISDNKNSDELYLNDLQYALEHLSDEHREIILLVGLEQMSYRETATILDIPQGTVMSRLMRARQKLKEVMNNQSDTRRAQ